MSIRVENLKDFRGRWCYGHSSTLLSTMQPLLLNMSNSIAYLKIHIKHLTRIAEPFCCHFPLTAAYLFRYTACTIIVLAPLERTCSGAKMKGTCNAQSNSIPNSITSPGRPEAYARVQKSSIN